MRLSTWPAAARDRGRYRSPLALARHLAADIGQILAGLPTGAGSRAPGTAPAGRSASWSHRRQGAPPAHGGMASGARSRARPGTAGWLTPGGASQSITDEPDRLLDSCCRWPACWLRVPLGGPSWPAVHRRQVDIRLDLRRAASPGRYALAVRAAGRQACQTRPGDAPAPRAARAGCSPEAGQEMPQATASYPPVG